MEFLNIKIFKYNNGTFRGTYSCSIIKDEEGNLNGFGEEGYQHTFISLKGKQIGDEIYLVISFDQKKTKYNDLSNIELRANLGKEYYFSEDPQSKIIGRSYYYGKTLDEYYDDVRLEVTNIKEFIKSSDHEKQFIKE